MLVAGTQAVSALTFLPAGSGNYVLGNGRLNMACLLYTSDAADERSSVDLGGRRIIKKKKREDRQQTDRTTQTKASE